MPLLTEFFDGVCAGISVLIAALSLLVGIAFREPMLRWHCATLLVGLLAQLPFVIPGMYLPAELWLLQLVLAAHTLQVVLGNAGAVRRPARIAQFLLWGLLALMLLRLVGLDGHMYALLPWVVITGWYLVRSWGQNRPWIYWIALGQLALGLQWFLVTLNTFQPYAKIMQVSLLPALAVFACATYIGMVWRSRILSENTLRIEARHRVDPLTGLSTAQRFTERLEDALLRSKSLGYTSALLLIRLQKPPGDDQEVVDAEGDILLAAQVISKCLRPQDVAARLSGNRFGVLAEGVRPQQGGQELATRILASALRGKAGSPGAAPLRFQMAVMEITNPQTDAAFFMQVLDNAMRQMVLQPDGPPIRTLS